MSTNRIIWLLPSRNPMSGGPVRVANTIVHELNKQGHKINLVELNPYLIQDKNLKLSKLNRIVNLLTSLSISVQYKFKAIIEIYFSNTIIFSGIWSLILPLLYIISIASRKSLIIRTSGMLMPFYFKKNRIRHKLALLVYVIPILQSTRVVKLCNSRREMKLLTPFQAVNCTYIENPLTTSYLDWASQEVLLRRFTLKNVLFYSRIHPVKGLHLAIQAVSLAIKIIPNIKLIIAGPVASKFYLTECMQLIRESNSPNSFIFTGPIYSLKDKYNMFDQSSCHLHPTFAEGFPNVVVESASAGLPLLTTAESNLDKSLRNQMGYNITHSPDQICKCLILLFNNFDKYCEMSRSSARLANENYSTSIITNKYSSLLQSLTN